MPNGIGCVSLNVYTATGKDTDGMLTFAAGAPPTDGSVAIAILKLDPAFGEFESGGYTQNFLFFKGSGQAQFYVHPPVGQHFMVWTPIGWSLTP